MTTIGTKIKQLRKAKGFSQTELAAQLGVTAQAVSKWESDNSMPDITLLPAIAAIFGIAIDDLFEYSKEKQYEKINHMIEYNRFLTNGEFSSAEKFLLEEIEQNAVDYKALSTLADLYHFQATRLDQKSVHFAKQALILHPNSKADINTISNASGGKVYDWNICNHHELIDYFYKMLRDEPKNTRIYFYLLDNLIDDGRIQEARAVLSESFSKNPDSLNEAYAIYLEEHIQGFSTVKAQYEELAQKYSNDWRVLFNIANSFSHHEYYAEAIGYWQRAFDAMEVPRYTDFYDAMAQCYLRLGNNTMAVEIYQKEKQLLHEEWGLKFGRDLDIIDDKITQIEKIR